MLRVKFVIFLLSLSLGCVPSFTYQRREFKDVKHFTVIYPSFWSDSLVNVESEIHNPVAKTLVSVIKEELLGLGYEYTEDPQAVDLIISLDYKIRKNKAYVDLTRLKVKFKNLESNGEINGRIEVSFMDYLSTEAKVHLGNEVELMKGATRDLVKNAFRNKKMSLK